MLEPDAPWIGFRCYLDCTYMLVGDRRRRYIGSFPMVGLRAATAAGRHPYPFRTRPLSPPAFRQVLECESLWKHRFAAHHSYSVEPASTAPTGSFTFPTQTTTTASTVLAHVSYSNRQRQPRQY